MRGIRIPAAAPRFALALLVTTALLGCGAAQRPDRHGTAHGSAAAKASTRTTAAQGAVPGSGPGSDRLTAIAFASRSDGYWRAIRLLTGDTSGGTFQVTFVSRRDGFVLGDDARNNDVPTIWRTTDGGTRWFLVRPQPS